MGTFRVTIEIGDESGENFVSVEALVDTGATVSSVPASILKSLGVHPSQREQFEFGNGTTREMEIGLTHVRVEGKETITPVLFNDEGTIPLLGAMTLEGLFLGVDPHNERLVPVTGLLM